MKILPRRFQSSVFILLVTMLGIEACQRCELIDQIVTPPAIKCSGRFYLLKTSPELDTTFYLYQLEKPIPDPYAPAFIAGPLHVGTTFGHFPSNFSAFDSLGGLYIFQHFYSTGSQFLSYPIGTNQPMLTTGPPIDVCPVFHGNPSKKLYSIYIENLSGNEWLYNIARINPLTGQDGAGITGNTITTNSPLSVNYVSSASNDGNQIYFLSMTNLIAVDISNNNSWHYDIDLTFTPLDNPVQYFGLEYKRDEGLLIAMKQYYDEVNIPKTSLVSIDISGSAPVVTELFNISAALPIGIENNINTEFYSTTFDQCDNTYYITCVQPGATINTNFIEINLDEKILKRSTLDGYWYGLKFAAD